MNFKDLVAKFGLATSLLSVKLMLFFLAVVFYWVYNASLLAAYGIGPELNVRELFESKLVITWLSLNFLKPAFIFIGLTAVLIAVVDFLINRLKRFLYRKASWALLTKISSRKKLSNIDQWSSGLLAVMVLGFMILIGVAYFSRQAIKQVKNQIHLFLEEDKCTDLFNNESLGCYLIPGVKGNHLLIFNGQKAYAYITKIIPDEKSKSLIENAKAKVTIVYKNPSMEIVRWYVPKITSE